MPNSYKKEKYAEIKCIRTVTPVNGCHYNILEISWKENGADRPNKAKRTCYELAEVADGPYYTTVYWLLTT